MDEKRGRILIGKKEILDYTTFGRTVLDDCIRNLKFPVFVIGSNRQICSHTDAIERWFLEMSITRYHAHEAQDSETAP